MSRKSTPKYVRNKRKTASRFKDKILQRDGAKCCFCSRAIYTKEEVKRQYPEAELIQIGSTVIIASVYGIRMNFLHATIEHTLPFNHPDCNKQPNLKVACARCNNVTYNPGRRQTKKRK